LANHGQIQREAAILKADDIRQWNGIRTHNQCQMALRTQAQHLGTLVATHPAKGQQIDFGWLRGGGCKPRLAATNPQTAWASQRHKASLAAGMDTRFMSLRCKRPVNPP
jgi:hypothetical protein